MRTLKKTLSLVLALVLCLGLVGTAFASNYDKYTDAETVGDAYKEAVDVLMGIGVVDGMSATEIGATGTYTRAQAAKIVAYMKLGTVAAGKLSSEKAPFDDVPVDHWAAAYIDYCVQAGVIKGYGDGKFGPDDALTGYAFGAMLLRAVGYGVNGEYDGAGYSIKVAQDAIPLGVYAGDLGAAVNTPIERQQAMLMAFNTLTEVACVKWSTLLGAYVNLDYTITGSAAAVEDVVLAQNFNMYCTEWNNGAGPADFLAWNGVDSYAVDGVKVPATYNQVGRQAHVWYKMVKGLKVAISDVYFDDALLGTSNNGTSIANLTDITKPTYIAKKDAGIKYYKNGAATAGNAEVTPVRGALVELYDVFPFDGDVDYVIYTEKTVATVGANGVKYNTAKTTATVDGIVVAPTSVKKLDNFADLKFGDVVLYVKDGAGVTHFEKATGFQSQLKKTTILNTGDISYLIGEDTYLLSGLTGSVNAAGMNVYNTDYNYYLDNYGNLVAAVAVREALSDFVIVLDLGTELGGVFTNDTPYAKILKMDGTVEAVKVEKITNALDATAYDTISAHPTDKDKVKVGVVDATETNYTYKYYTYKVGTTGAYTFTTARAPYAQDTKSAAANTVKNNVSAITLNNTFYANASTVYIYKTSPVTYGTVTGLVAAPTNSATAQISVLAMNTGKVAKYVFIDAQPDLSAAGNAIFFVNPAWYLEVGADTVNNVPAYNQYQAIVGNELTTVDVWADATGTAPTQGIQVPTFKSGRVSNLSAIAAPAEIGIGFGASDTAVLMVGDEALTYTANTKVYEININPLTGIATLNTEVVGVGDITADVNDKVYVVRNAGLNTQADVLYIVKVADPTVRIAVKDTGAAVTGAGSALEAFQGATGTTAAAITNSSVTYKWFQNGTVVTGATTAEPTLTLAAGDVITVQVTYASNYTGAKYVAEATVTIPA